MLYIMLVINVVTLQVLVVRVEACFQCECNEYSFLVNKLLTVHMLINILVDESYMKPTCKMCSQELIEPIKLAREHV